VSTQQVNPGVVLDEATVCTSTKATTNHIWKCIADFHGDKRHYYVRAI
jgi:hypothetical protein